LASSDGAVYGRPLGHPIDRQTAKSIVKVMFHLIREVTSSINRHPACKDRVRGCHQSYRNDWPPSRWHFSLRTTDEGNKHRKRVFISSVPSPVVGVFMHSRT